MQFDNSTASGGTVAINNGNVLPNGTLFNNDAGHPYTLTGSNGISGTGQVIKDGAGIVTMTTNNSYMGGTVINGGTLSIPAVGALGTGTGLAIANGAVLDYSGAASGNSPSGLTVNAGGGAIQVDNAGASLGMTGAVSGTASLLKAGLGGLTLAGPGGGYNGAITVSQGTLAVTDGSAIGPSASITLGDAHTGADHPTLVLNNTGMTIDSLTVASSVSGATLSFPQNAGSYNYTVNGEITLNSPLNVNQSNASYPNWSQFINSSKITGNGGGSGNDTLVFNNTSGMQVYWTSSRGGQRLPRQRSRQERPGGGPVRRGRKQQSDSGHRDADHR